VRRSAAYVLLVGVALSLHRRICLDASVIRALEPYPPLLPPVVTRTDAARLDLDADVVGACAPGRRGWGSGRRTGKCVEVLP
jgi:hypothetical protein